MSSAAEYTSFMEIVLAMVGRPYLRKKRAHLVWFWQMMVFWAFTSPSKQTKTMIGFASRKRKNCGKHERPFSLEKGISRIAYVYTMTVKFD